MPSEREVLLTLLKRAFKTIEANTEAVTQATAVMERLEKKIVSSKSGWACYRYRSISLNGSNGIQLPETRFPT